MASNNNEGGGLFLLLALVIFILYAIFLFLFTAGAFLAVIFTILSVLAWNNPLNLFGYVIEPREARAFVGRGIVGMILLPLFALFSGWFLEFSVDDESWFYLLVGGYVLGSVGIEYQRAKNGEDGLVVRDYPTLPAQPPVLALPSNRTRKEITPEDADFEFATWDDEEDR